MEAGEDTAKGLGINTERERVVGMIMASVLAAVIVSFFGIIAFIGLLGPHIARMIIGSDHRHLIPLSIILGAIILILADRVGQVVLYPSVIPAGIITSMLGGPLFVYLQIRRYRARCSSWWTASASRTAAGGSSTACPSAWRRTT
jgi:iron complex transport system permease protein